MANENALLALRGNPDFLPDYETTVAPAPRSPASPNVGLPGFPRGRLPPLPENALATPTLTGRENHVAAPHAPSLDRYIALTGGTHYTPLGRLVESSQNLYRDQDGREVAVNASTDVIGHDGIVYARNETAPPDPEAAAYSARPGIIGKALSAVGVPDYSGERANTSWQTALDNTLRGFSLPNMLHGGIGAANRLMMEGPNGLRRGADAPEGAAIAGTLVASTAPGAVVGSAVAGVPRSTISSFFGRDHALNLLRNEGNPIPLRAIDEATAMERRGASDRQIHTEVNRLIQQHDPNLGPIYRPAESELGAAPLAWLVEHPNNETMVLSRMPAESTTLSNVLLDPTIYHASPESARMPVLSGSAAYRAATRDGLPVMGDAAARYIPMAEGGHGRIELGTDVHNARKILLEELGHNLEREAGLTAGTSPAAERAKLLASGEWLNDPVAAQLHDRLLRGDGAARAALEERINHLAFEKYRTNSAEVRQTLTRERSEMSAGALHRYLPEVNEALIVPRSEQHLGGTYTPAPAGGRPVSTQEVVALLRQMGVDNIRVKQVRGDGTEYIKFDQPDNIWQHGRNQARPTVRIPTDVARHGGNPPNSAEVGNLFDTGVHWGPGRSPHPSSTLNESGGPFSRWKNLLAALKWRLSRSPDGQWLISPDQAPIGRHPNPLMSEEPHRGPMPADPAQGVLDLSEAAAPRPAPNGGNLPIYSDPAIHGVIERGMRYGYTNAEIVAAIKDRTGVSVTPSAVNSYIFRMGETRSPSGRARPTQDRALEFIRGEIERGRAFPTPAQINERMGWERLSTRADDMLAQLVRTGRIVRNGRMDYALPTNEGR